MSKKNLDFLSNSYHLNKDEIIIALKAFDANVMSDRELDILIAFFSANNSLLEYLGEPFSLQQRYMQNRFSILERIKERRKENKEKVVILKDDSK